MTASGYRDAIAQADKSLERGNIDEARTHFQSAIDLSDSEERRFTAEMGVAVCHARRGHWTEAIDTLTEITARHPESGVALAYLGAARFEVCDFDVARAELDSAVLLSPTEPLVYVKRGEANYRLGLLREALADFQHAARLPDTDQNTLTYVRAAIVSVRKELESVIERTIPSPSKLWRRGNKKSAPTHSVIEPVVGGGQLVWRDS